jgi:uncharacterized coiled-coil protein SlyX
MDYDDQEELEKRIKYLEGKKRKAKAAGNNDELIKMKKEIRRLTDKLKDLIE